MAFCVQCGHEIQSGAKFCSECGSPVGSFGNQNTASHQTKQKDVSWEGSIRKCPRCGEPLNAFSATCHACGYELRDSRASSSVAELSRKLEQMTEQAHSTSVLNVIGGVLRGALAPDEEDPRAGVIKSFPVPNTKEDLLEFIILATSNINADAFSKSKSANLSPSERSLSKAWYAKLDQVYQKAAIVLKGDIDFEEVSHLYESTKEQVRIAQLGMKRFFVK